MDYERARFKASLNRLLSMVLLKPAALMPMSEVGKVSSLTRQIRHNIQQVCLACIEGSINRLRDFDRHFYPLNNVTRQRWERINEAFLAGETFPPVSLMKLGDHYFVEDGHHRISVARFHGAAFIDAEVTEYVCAEGVAAQVAA